MPKVSGKEIAEEIIAELSAKTAPKRILAAVLVGTDSASESFLRQKERVADKLGVDFRIYNLSPDLGNDGLRKEVGKIARGKRVGGVILQLPLPEGINKQYVLNAIPPEKDLDVLSERALGAFSNDRNPIRPPAVEVVAAIVERENIDLQELVIAVVGVGALVGKPISMWLTGRCGELRLYHRGSDLNQLKEADLVISGVGKAGLIKANSLKRGSGVIDFGYGQSGSGGLAGDLGTEGADENLSFYTPTPGGTGPILVAKLMENFYKINSA